MPPSLTPLLSSLRYTPIVSLAPLRTLFTSSTPPSQPTVTRYLLRQPWAGASRECPTPIILVRALNLSSAYSSLSHSDTEEETWEDWGGMFSEKGYTALEVDVTAPSSPPLSSSGETSPLKAMSTLLASQIRLLAIPFPPILVSEGDSCVLTQMYVEDNPASGLVLIDPPGDGSSQKDITVKHADEGGWQVPTFGFEPAFPILLVSSPDKTAQVEASRLGMAAQKGRGRGGKGVVVESLVDGARAEKSRVVVERWMDSCGF